MTCPVCRAPIAPGASFCDFCRVAVRYEADRVTTIHPPIHPGPPLLALDLRSDGPPGYTKRQHQWESGTKMDPTNDGIVVAVTGSQTMPFVQEFLRLRDAICRASMIAYDQE